MPASLSAARSACIRARAVLAGVALPVIRERLSPGKLVLVVSLLAYASMALLSISRHWVPAAFAVVLFGAAWLAAGTTLGAVAQMTSGLGPRSGARGVPSRVLRRTGAWLHPVGIGRQPARCAG